MVLLEGFCNYCAQPKMVEVPEGMEQDKINEEATKICTCLAATSFREKKQQKEACISNIEALLEPKNEEAARILKDSIDAIQDSKIKKITINTYGNYTARMSKTKDGIKVELEKKQKAETLA